MKVLKAVALICLLKPSTKEMDRPGIKGFSQEHWKEIQEILCKCFHSTQYAIRSFYFFFRAKMDEAVIMKTIFGRQIKQNLEFGSHDVQNHGDHLPLWTQSFSIRSSNPSAFRFLKLQTNLHGIEFCVSPSGPHCRLLNTVLGGLFDVSKLPYEGGKTEICSFFFHRY
jgi:hypothetical protein